jgi:hypothetical protein
MDEAICSPTNILVDPTERKPVTLLITITGISMKVLR